MIRRANRFILTPPSSKPASSRRSPACLAPAGANCIVRPRWAPTRPADRPPAWQSCCSREKQAKKLVRGRGAVVGRLLRLHREERWKAPHFSQPNLPGVLLISQEAFHSNADISEVSTAVFSSYGVCTVRHRVIKASGPCSFRFWLRGGWLSWSWAGEERIYLCLKTAGAAELRKPLEMTAGKRGDSSTQRALEKCIQQLQAWEDL